MLIPVGGELVGIVLDGAQKSRDPHGHPLTIGFVTCGQGKLLARQCHRVLHDVEMIVISDAAWEWHTSSLPLSYPGE